MISGALDGPEVRAPAAGAGRNDASGRGVAMGGGGRDRHQGVGGAAHGLFQ